MYTAFMRKHCLVILPVLLTFAFTYSQSPVYKITQQYFRSDPFQSEFSSFLNHLLNDPTLINKITEKKTDSSLFFFQGTYTNHSPFFFKAKKTDVILMEMPVELDSLRTDTIVTYQLIAFNDDTKEGTQEIKKEFEKIYRRYKGAFNKNSYTENPPGSKSPGATYNFYDPFHAVAPFAVTWYGPSDKKEMSLILTVRMSVKRNIAILPVPFYTF
jgi:hypothetical protein